MPRSLINGIDSVNVSKFSVGYPILALYQFFTRYAFASSENVMKKFVFLQKVLDVQFGRISTGGVPY